MRKLTVGDNIARFIDNQGRIHMAFRDDEGWKFEGRVYSSPFDAFEEVENELQRRISGL